MANAFKHDDEDFASDEEKEEIIAEMEEKKQPSTSVEGAGVAAEKGEENKAQVIALDEILQNV